jgi:GMP synthase-like glutamine amidotransferase
MNIGILQTGEAPDPLRPVTGDYPDMFEILLAGRVFDFRTYRVLDGDFPASVTECDGWLITGSRFGVYEGHPFIPPLEQFIRDALAAGVPVAGICFGHQSMAQAMGGRVEKFAGGWSVGANTYDFDGQAVTLNAWHQDQVVVPPPGARTVARSDFCAHAALAYGDRGLSVQAHPEFTPAFIRGLIDTRGRGVVPEDRIAAAEQALSRPLDSGRIADRIAEFFLASRR